MKEADMAATDQDLKTAVKEHYAEAARRVRSEGRTGCCGPSSCGCSSVDDDPITRDLYDATEIRDLPADAVAASLGCGNPTALATLQAGETVLDLGSGGGIDVLLSAKRVGPTGKAYGLDMTDEMLALARENQRSAGVANAEFLKGDIEAIPLPDDSVDVIISNCVINLSGDKDRVLREAYRVIKPGGRFAVSDIVRRGDARIPAEVQKNLELWAGCISGALSDREYAEKLARAGFGEVSIEPTRFYEAEDARAFIESAGLDYDAVAAGVNGAFFSAFVRARKPGRSA
jgi:arsenite methyltransferase